MTLRNPDLFAAGGIVFLLLLAGLAPVVVERDTMSRPQPQPTMVR